LMLRIWNMHRSDLHSKISPLGVSNRPLAESRTPDMKRADPGARRTFGDPRKQVRKEPVHQLKASEKAYVVKEASSKVEELERRVRSLLNKICPENLRTIVERLAGIELSTAEELEHVIRIIFGKALAEPHYCETYADMVFCLCKRYPEFPPENPGEKPHTFTRVLLNTVQNEFESLPSTFEATEEEKENMQKEELALEMKRRKDKMLANMKFIGHLFLRQLLAVKVIGQVVADLIGMKEGLPEEHMIECVCELLKAIGYTLDDTEHGQNYMNSFASRLKDLGGQRRPDGSRAYSKRIQFQIENMLDLRKNKWHMKLFKEQAKTKDDVRRDAAKEARQQGRGADATFSTALVGARPAYMEEIARNRPKAKAPDANQKPSFTQDYVRRLFQYYAEEKNGDSLQADWTKAQPNQKEVMQGFECLLGIGFDDHSKADAVAMTLAEIMKRRLASWDVLREALTPLTTSLEDMQMDTPMAPGFFHALMARLILLGDAFNPSILKTLQGVINDSRQFAWKLVTGTLKKLKKEGGSDAVRKALSISEFVNCASSAKGCSASEAKRQLEAEL